MVTITTASTISAIRLWKGGWLRSGKSVAHVKDYFNRLAVRGSASERFRTLAFPGIVVAPSSLVNPCHPHRKKAKLLLSL